MQRIFMCLITICFASLASAQVKVPMHIAARLKGNKSFRAYAKQMTAYFDSLQVVSKDSTTRNYVDRQYKKLARQLYYLEGHQDEFGNIVNVSERNMDALAQYEQSDIAQSASLHLGAWSLVGPVHVLDSYGMQGIGRVDRIAFHPTNSSIMYAGTPSGGLWRSSSGGISWGNVNSYMPSLGISGIVVSHANPSTLYVLTGDGDSNLGDGGFVEGFDYIRPSTGIYKSTDAGETWTKTGLDIPGFYVGYKLIQSPFDANVLLAATSKGIYRTADAGSRWSLVSSDSARYYDLEWHPTLSATVYATSRNRFFMSATAGQSFANLTNRIPEDISGCGRIALAVTPNNANVVYVYAGQHNGGSSYTFRLFRSTNSGGAFFTRTIWNSGGGSVEYMLNVAADPSDFNKVVVGNLNCRFSDDGGLNWVRFSTDDDSQGRFVHADIHELAFNPLTNKLFIGSDGGVFSSTDHGDDISPHFLNMSTSQFYHFAVADNDENLMLGGAQDNGLMYKDGTTSLFKNFMTGDGFDVAMPHDQGTFIVATVNTETFFFHKSFPSTYWYLNLQNNVWYKPVATSFFDSTKYSGGKQVLRWKAFSSGSVNVSSLDANGNWALVTSPSNGNRLYAAGGPGWNDGGEQSEKTMMRSDDNGDTWTAIHGSTGFPRTFGKITSVAVHPSNSNKVYVTFGGYQAGVKVFYSANAGASWSNFSGGLPDLPVNAIVVNDNGDMYIGTDIGVYYREEGGSGWMPYLNGLPKIPVTDLQIYNSYLYASTFGRGIWGSPTRGNCPPTENITDEQSGRIFYEARTITASSELVRGAGTEIYLKAETSVTLTPGFRANGSTGVEFRAWIAPCGMGGMPMSLSGLVNKNNVALKLDTSGINFNLNFPALVTACLTDSLGNVQGILNKPIRMMEGPQKLSFSTKLPYHQLVLVADGDVVGTVLLNKEMTREKMMEKKPE